jgi:alpha-1,3/alpha-1,6-mannosyltransferase
MPPKAKKPSSSSTKRKSDASSKNDTVVFFHPDLGIGGAERLVVDAAVGLQERGHRVVIFTNHCDPSHCFDECRDGKPPPISSILLHCS